MRILSLGAGVQSSTLLLMSIAGQVEKLDAAVFADTGWEPMAVYEHLEWLERVAGDSGVKVVRTAKGNIRKDALRSMVRGIVGEGSRAASIPYYTQNADGTVGSLRRQCSREYKIEPIRREVRKLARLAGEKQVEVWIGISWDEALRMKPADVNYITHRWPLIEMHMTRQDCLRWMRAHGFAEPPRSSCLGCPYHSNAEWREIALRPDEFEDVVAFDQGIRNSDKTNSKLYLHRSARPISEIDFRNEEDKGQLSLWTNECEGICGV